MRGQDMNAICKHMPPGGAWAGIVIGIFSAMQAVQAAPSPPPVTIGSPPMKAALVPRANVYFVSDAAATLKTAIRKKIEALKLGLPNGGAGRHKSRLLLVQEMVHTITDALGIKRKDLSAVVFSLSLEGYDLQGMPDWSQASALLAVGLAKPVSMAGVKRAVDRLAADNGWDLMYDQTQYRGFKMLSVMSAGKHPKPKWPQEIFVGLSADGETIYVGIEAAVKGAVDRLADDHPARLTPAMSAARKTVPEGAQSFLLFVPTDAIRAKLHEWHQRLPPKKALMAGALEALSGLKDLVYSTREGSKIDVTISMDLQSDQLAIQMKSVIDMAVLGMAKMSILQRVGHPIPMLDTMKSDQQGTRVTLQLALTEVDLKALMDMRPAGAPAPGPGGEQAPPIPPAPQAEKAAPAPP